MAIVPKRSRIDFIGAVLFLSVAFGTIALTMAEDCPRGQLDPRYCDRNGDLLADAPPLSERKDPATLIFAYTPLEDPAVYRKVWQGFLDHLARATGKKVSFFPVQSNAAQVEALRAGRLHVAGFSAGTVPYAVNVAGFTPLVTMARADGSSGYEMELIVAANAPLAKVEQLKGKKLAFTSPTSNSGYKAPKVLLEQKFDLKEGRDYTAAFSGKHDASILGVVNGDYAAAAVANSVLRQMASRGVVDLKALRTLYRSESFPTTAYGIAHDLSPELAAKIRSAFETFDWNGTALLAEFGATEGTQFRAVDYRRDWTTIRAIDQALGIDYVTGKP